MPCMDVFRIHLNPNKTLPLALGNMGVMVARHRPELLDFLNLDTPILTDRLLAEKMVRSGGFSKTAIFLMSNYVWNIQAHTALSQALKAVNPQHVIVHGGPSVAYKDRSSIFIKIERSPRMLLSYCELDFPLWRNE